MVLTNVGNSRINSCQNFTFDFYYDFEALQDMYPDVKFISQSDFHFNQFIFGACPLNNFVSLIATFSIGFPHLAYILADNIPSLFLMLHFLHLLFLNIPPLFLTLFFSFVETLEVSSKCFYLTLLTFFYLLL